METSERDTLRRYFEAHPEWGVAAAYLFGSHAAGREHRESDVDLAVLLLRDRHPTESDCFDVRVRLTSELIHVRDVQILAADLEPYLRKWEKVLLESLAR